MVGVLLKVLGEICVSARTLEVLKEEQEEDKFAFC